MKGSHLSDAVDVAIGEQLLLQRAQQLMQVGRLVAVRRRRPLQDLVAVLLELPEGLILEAVFPN